MSKGFWAGEAIASGLEVVAAQSGRLSALKAASHATDTAYRIRQKYDELDAEYEALAAGNAANLAEKMALRKALAKLDPKHPLLTNSHLKERIHKAAQQVYALSESSWTDVGNVGRDFLY